MVRLWSLQKPRVLPSAFVQRIEALIKDKKHHDAEVLCSEYPLPAVIHILQFLHRNTIIISSKSHVRFATAIIPGHRAHGSGRALVPIGLSGRQSMGFAQRSAVSLILVVPSLRCQLFSATHRASASVEDVRDDRSKCTSSLGRLHRTWCGTPPE